MNYELAQQLKDAGFPQSFEHGDFVSPDNVYHGHIRWNDDDVYAPTLEELIEACGKDFMLTNECSKWEAWSNIGAARVYPVRMGETGAEHMVEGSTPIEAVAKLWLALQKNS